MFVFPSGRDEKMAGMDRLSLESFLNDGLSLAEIGTRVDLHEATVGYWVKKYELQAVNQEKHAGRGGLRQEDLQPLVEKGLSIGEIAHAVSRSKGTVRHWLNKYELRTSQAGRGRSRVGAREAREAGLAQVVLDCPRHGSIAHVLEARGYYRCRRCRQEAVVRRRRKVKRILVAEMGGCCKLCGYSSCPAALEFHHLDPDVKQFGIAQKGMARSIERLRTEVLKCVLLCANCHAEVEAGFPRASPCFSEHLPSLQDSDHDMS
ncbi:MAG TPA: hypothetical protein VGF15_03665 [Solirubrobacteraceae bacterium]|jgi:transposase